MCSTAAACPAGRQAGTGDAAASLNYNMLGSQVGRLLYLWKKQQIRHGCSVSPDEDGGLLEEGNLVVQVQALQVHNLHHTVGPLLQDARLHLSCIQQVPQLAWQSNLMLCACLASVAESVGQALLPICSPNSSLLEELDFVLCIAAPVVLAS